MTIKGDAGFTYTASGSTAVTTFTLEAPLRNFTPIETGNRFTHWSADNTARNVVSIGSTSVDEVVARVRYENDVSGFKALAREGLNDTTLTYFPSLASTDTSFPCKLVSVGGANDRTELPADTDRWYDLRYEAEVRLRRVDGGTFNTLVSST